MRKVDKYIIDNELLDRRFKLTKEQKEQIKKEYVPYTNTTKTNGENVGSIHWLANKYGVSRRLISSIVNDKKIEHVPYEDRKHWNSQTKENRLIATKRHREYKKILLEQDKLKLKTNIFKEIKYNPTEEEIKKICDDAYEEDKEQINKAIKYLEKM